MKKTKIQQKKESVNGMLLTKSLPNALQSLDDDRKAIEIKFASFGNTDSDRDLLVKGCFAKSISERGPESSTNRKIAFCWQHDIKDPIGKIEKIEEREDGAYAVVKLCDFEAVPNAKRAYSQLQDGSINQFSFGFNYVWDKVEYDEEQDCFVVKEVKLHEISIVTMGANEQTEYIGEIKDMKSFLKTLKDKDINKYNELVEAIKGDAEPGQPLTRQFLQDCTIKFN